ncbi:hypothetical protein BGW36DRAFT_378586 [Talaromyces proteolyticus]|uniref:PSI domain-containing protein n=1 Tax=Talaromyces proteolyticus TaxID=1131652 RepID=A0AAD4PW25_9EURO|nr:uncharacterized protein BGW36DRAFT_378586 [Talaromyces proteolyticus]KAH8697380.1 hypothetical protein BGW36DRAFT_378586 [Talaromyces proteolyticus]
MVNIPEVSFLPNGTVSENGGDPVKLLLCWVRQSCDDCISMKDDIDCSWCPFSSTCVPNPSPNYPLLAPIEHPDICPMGAKERWEVRARGLGCNVSTRNFLSVSAAVAASFVLMVLVALLYACLKATARSCARRQDRRERGYLHVVFFRGWGGRSDMEGGRYERRRRERDGDRVDERSPLLPD